MPTLIAPPRAPVPRPGARVAWGLPLTAGLVAFWPMTEVDGARAIDVVGRWHAEFAAGPIWRPGLEGMPALEMTVGTASRAVAPAGVIPWSTAWSVVGWGRPTAYTGVSARLAESSAVSGGFSIEWDSGSGNDRLAGVFWNGGTSAVLAPLAVTPLDQWHQAALTYDGVQARFYLNGQLEAGPTTTTVSAPTFLFRIGNFNNGTGNTFPGAIGPVGYWKRALSAQEVAALFRDPYAPIRSSAQRFWVGQGGVTGSVVFGGGALGNYAYVG